MSENGTSPDYVEGEAEIHRLPTVPASALSRTLPHSLEAEEYLISSCLLDGTDVIERCIEARVQPASFYDPKHGLLFTQILALHAKKLPVSVDVIAEQLKTERQLDQVGGYAFLSQVSSRVPTTAQAAFFIERVREQAALRDFIRAATSTVEDAYGFSGDIASFSDQVRDRMERVINGSSGAEQLLAECEYDDEADEVVERIVFSLAGVPMFTGGNLANLVAGVGVGKSAVVGAIFAAAMTEHPDGQDFLGFSGRNYEGLPLLHFDTEQSKHDYQKLIWRSKKRAGVENIPKWFHSYHLTGKPAQECRQTVEAAISRHARKHGGLFAVLIDGWADLVMDPNDSEEVFAFVARMHGLAIKHDIPIIGVLHLNPGSEDKSRGHLGSQLERKVSCLLQFEMDQDQVTTLWAKKKRGRQLVKDHGPRFAWNDTAGMHTLLEGWTPEKAAEISAEKRARRKRKEPEEKVKIDDGWWLRSFPAHGDTSFSLGQIKRAIGDSSGAAGTAKINVEQLVFELMNKGLLQPTPTGVMRTVEGEAVYKKFLNWKAVEQGEIDF